MAKFLSYEVRPHFLKGTKWNLRDVQEANELTPTKHSNQVTTECRLRFLCGKYIDFI